MARLLALCEAMIVLAAARLALRLFPIGRLIPSASRPGLSVPSPEPADACVRLVAWAIERGAARLPWRSKCLVRALAARLMLSRRGVSTSLCLGVAREGEDVLAHAWLVAGGRIVCGGRERSGYTPIATAVRP